MRSIITSGLVLVATIFAVSSAAAGAMYAGSLTYTPPFPADSTDGVYVGPSGLQWVTYTVSVNWTVTDTDTSQPGYPWKYSYTFGHDGTRAGISHIVVETSGTFTADDIVALSGASISSVGAQAIASGNPNMPSDTYGIRFAPLTASPFSMTFTFYSDRAPVWGDFYARCGGMQGGINYAYNFNDTLGNQSGFLPVDVDPLAPPSSGSVGFHILVPNTVPEPASMVLLAVGGLGLLHRRRMEA